MKKAIILVFLGLVFFNFSNAENVTNAIKVNIYVNDAQLEFLNDNYDFVLTSTLSEEIREKIQNPELLLYRSIQGTWTDFDHFDWEHIDSNENMFCHYDSLDQSENTRILTVWNSWLMDGNDLVDSTEVDALNHWINYYAVTASTQVNSCNYDGLFIDSASHNLSPGALEDPTQMPWDYDEDEWREGRYQALQFIKSHFPDKIVIFNGLHSEHGADSSLTFTDGGMWEDFVYDVNDGHYKGINEWWAAIECLQNNNEDNLLSLVVKKPGLIDDYQARLFSISSYFLIANENVALSLSDFTEPIHRMIQYFPEYDISLGNSLGDFEMLDDTLFVREFENGLVLVNPTETNTKIYNLENDCLKIVPIGGGIIDETVFYDGQLTYEAVSIGEIEIPPVCGVILRNFIFGDVDGNGEIQAFDAALALQYSAELIEFEEWQILAGDVDGNGIVQAYDAALILQYSAGLIDEFPMEGK